MYTQFHRMQAWFDNISDTTIRFISWQSVVLDIDHWKHVITLYPRWQYSMSTKRQVTRFIGEHVGYVCIDDLRACVKQPDTKLYGYSVVFSNEFKYGY